MQIFRAHKFFKACERSLFSKEVVARGRHPIICELGIVNEDVGRTWSEGAILQILFTAVQEQCVAACIKKDGGKWVVMALRNQRTLRSFQQSVDERARRKIGIEHDEREARGVKEQDHHQSGSDDGPLPNGSKCSQWA